MEITWTFNFLESIAFIGLTVAGLIVVIRALFILWFWLLWKN